MTGKVFELLVECVRGKQADDYVFTRKDGNTIGDFRKLWSNVCTEAGVAGLLVYDLRRTAARNLRRAGLPKASFRR